MNGLTSFDGHKYLNLETYRRTGEAMPTPVWFVSFDGALYVRTIANSGKVKRARNNSTARVAPCAADGSLLNDWLPARAVEAADEATAARVADLLLEKYGPQVKEFERRTLESGQRYTVLKIELE